MKSKIYIVTGHYGSGKTEFAVNYALSLKETNEKVILVDMDIVNPYFRSNDSRTLLEDAGITVIAPSYAGTNVDIPALPADLMRIFAEDNAQIVLDVGGDDDGAIALGRYKHFFDDADYEMYLVVNTRRPLTTNAQEIIQMKTDIETASRLTVSSLVSATNLAEETTAEIAEEGVSVVEEVSQETGLPIAFVCVTENVLKIFPARQKIRPFALHGIPLKFSYIFRRSVRPLSDPIIIFLFCGQKGNEQTWQRLLF